MLVIKTQLNSTILDRYISFSIFNRNRFLIKYEFKQTQPQQKQKNNKKNKSIDIKSTRLEN